MQASYPLAERDPNISGRTSRASNLSANSKGGIYRKHAQLQHAKADLLPAAPGVLGMLRTTTEIGDVALLPFSNRKFGRPVNGHHFQQQQQMGLQRRQNGTASRQSSSSASSHKQQQQQQRGVPSLHQPWPSVSSAGRKRSMTSNVTAPQMPDQSFLSNVSGRAESVSAIPSSHDFAINRNSGRSMSLSNAMLQPGGFPRNRSLTSLRSRPDRPRRPLSPGYRYPTRLRRPGFRSASPLMTDMTGASLLHHAGSRLNPDHAQLALSIGQAPYPAMRNRSAPTVTTLARQGSTQAMRGHGLTTPARDDAGSVSDRSVKQSHIHSMPRPQRSITDKSSSIRTHSRGSLNHGISVPPYAIASRTPPLLEHATTDSVKAPATDGVRETAVVVEPAGDAQHDLEKEISEMYNDTISDITPMPAGLVDRIRALLDAVDRSALLSEHRSSVAASMDMPDLAPLLASAGGPPVIAKRITRDLIIQALAPSSEDSDPSTVNTGISTEQQEDLGDLTNNLVTSTQVGCETTDVDGPSIGSISQSFYSRPTNFTEPSILPLESTDVPPVPSLPVMDGSDHFELSVRPLNVVNAAHRSVMAVGKHQESTESLHDGSPAQTLDRVRRRWSIRPSVIPLFSQRATEHVNEDKLMSKTSLSPLAAYSDHGLIESHGHSKSDAIALKIDDPIPLVTQDIIAPVETSHASHITANSRVTETVPATETYDAGRYPRIEATDHATVFPTSINGSLRALRQQKSFDDEKHPLADSPASWLTRKEATASTTLGINYIGPSGDTIPEHAEVERFHMIRSPYVPLPDLKEESESRSDLRSMASTHAGPGSRLSGPRSIHDSIRLSRTDRNSKDADSIMTASKTYSVFKTTSSNLADAHAIPSLNFSSANLMSKLTDAWGMSTTLEKAADTGTASLRANSANMRDKYRSLFLSLEEIASDHEELAELASTHQAEILEQLAELDDLERDADGSVKEEKRLRTLRPLSPHELIEEVNRLSVPSVGALTQRLSEFFPTLRRFLSDSPLVLADKEKDVGDRYGGFTQAVELAESRPTTFSGSVDAGVLRQSVCVTGSQFGQAEGLSDVMERSVEIKASTDRASDGLALDDAYASGEGDQNGAQQTASKGRMRSLSDSEVDSSPTRRLTRYIHPSSRSLHSPEADLLPWNNASSYPWSNSIPQIDIRFPSVPSAVRTPESRPSRHRMVALSQSSQSSLASLPVTDGTSMMQGTDDDTLIKSTAGPVVVLPLSTKKHVSKSRRLFGTLSRKILGQSSAAQELHTPILLVTGDNLTPSALSQQSELARPLASRIESPTNEAMPAINPVRQLAATTNMDDVHSFFSDDSSTARRRLRQRDLLQRARQISPPRSTKLLVKRPQAGSIRNKFATGIRRKSLRRVEGAALTRSPSTAIPRPLSAPDMRHQTSHTPLIATSPAEARAKRLVDRLKLLLHRSGELLRSMSGRKRQAHPVDDEGWSDKGESYADLAVGALAELGAPTVRGAGGSSRTGSLLASPV